MIRSLIFDHDGTLVDSESAHFKLWQTLLAEYDIALSEAEYKRHMAGVPTRSNAQFLTQRHPQLPLSAEDLFKIRRARAKETVGRIASPLISGALALVQWAHGQQMKLAIATGATPLELGPTLTQHRLQDYFPVVATNEDVANPKPAPDVYLFALQQLQLPAHQCLAIEDSPTGMQSALAAGLHCLVVRNNYSAGHNFDGATAVVDSMAEAKEWCEVFINERSDAD